MSNQAWVTLATNDSYGLGALVLAHSLRRAGSAYPAVVLITPAVTEPMRERLNAVFAEVITVDVLDSGDSAHLALLQRPELGVTFTKLHCWNLTQYEKCVFLDADTLIVQNCDELFEREELSAAPDVGWPDCFNSGVFVFVPSLETYSRLLTFAQERGSFDGGDQGLLNAFFSDWAHGDINKHLPFLYNVTSAAFYSYLPALKHYGKNLKIIHFIGAAKPWLQQYNWQSRSVDAPEHLRELLQLWWDLFVGQVHTQLDTAMDSRSPTEDDEALERPKEAEVPLEPPQDNFSLYAPRLDTESEFSWHHPKSHVPEKESQDQKMNMSDIYDPWKHHRGNIPPWNVNSSEEPVNYVWDYLQQQETKTQSWQQPNYEYINEERLTQNTLQEHNHFDHLNHNLDHSHHNTHYHDNSHNSSQHLTHHSENNHHQHTYTHQNVHQTHESQKNHPPHNDSFHHSPSFHTETNEAPIVNDQAHHHQHDHSNNIDHSHHIHKSHNVIHQLDDPSQSQDILDHERNDHGLPHTESNIISGDSHKHSKHRFHHHHQDQDISNHTHHIQRHKTEVYRIHLDLKKQRRRQRLIQIRALANTTTTSMNGNGHTGESESEDDDFIPRHPYDGFYLRHISTIDPRGHKICSHQIPPTPISSPQTTPRPGSPEEECSSPVVSDYETASENCDETGVAGNLARVVPGATEFQREAIDELSRRQGWEAGNIDYMGADSFANIWAKISQSLNQAPIQQTQPIKEQTPLKDLKESEPVKEQASEVANQTMETSAESVAPTVTEVSTKPSELPSETVSANVESQVPPTPESTPEPPSVPVTETIPKTEVVDAPVAEAFPVAVTTSEAVGDATPITENSPSTETASKTDAPVPDQSEASKVSPVCTIAEVPKIDLESSAPETKLQTESVAQVEAKEEVPVATPEEIPAAAAAVPTETAPACQAPPTTDLTPEKISILASTDSPPLANTPAKEEAPSVPAAKLEERRKPVVKLQLSVPRCPDPLATPDSEQEDAASLAQSIIASELRATVTTVTAATPSTEVPTPRQPLQEQRLSVDEPEVPTPPVSLAQIGVKPKGKPTTAALIESSIKPEIKESPSNPSTPTTTSEAPKKKVTKKVTKIPPSPGSGDAPVPPPRKKEKKPKEK